MKIYLFLPTSLMCFKLPYTVSGNFSFDPNPFEENKLIHIETYNGKWVLYRSDDTKIMVNKQYCDKVFLEENQFYYIEKDNTRYVLYTSSLAFSGKKIYSYSEEFTLGNLSSHTIYYNCGFLNGLTINFLYQNHQLTMKKTGDVYVYINKKRLEEDVYKISSGDELDIYGLNIIFLNGMFMVSDKDNIIINESKLIPFKVPEKANPENKEVKDIELYKKEDMFSKSPRIRRVIKTKEIKLSTPPREESGKDLPLVLTIGPMLTMGVMSITMFLNTLSRVTSGETTYDKVLPQLITSGAMIVSMLFWPFLIQWYNRFQKRKTKKMIIRKYTKYLDTKKIELNKERELQKNILLENLITIEDCIQNIYNHNVNFWDKRVDQSDFLNVRLGIGEVPLDVKIDYPEDGFTIDESVLKDRADDLVKEFKYISNVPVGYSLYESRITAIMGLISKTIPFTQNILLQLITFYSYEDLKIVLFTNEEREKDWFFLRFLNHNFTNEKDMRFLATSKETAKELADYLYYILNLRKNIKKDDDTPHKPHY